MFYFLNRDYTPNTAATNRSMAYLKQLSEKGIKTTVVYWYPDKRKSRIDASIFPGVNFVYLWEVYKCPNNKILLFLWFHFVAFLFCQKLKKGDIVYIYNLEDVLHKIIKIDGVSVYHERTEHPKVVGVGIHFWTVSLKQYLKDCSRLSGLFVISGELKDYYISCGVPESIVYVINMFADKSRFQGLSKDVSEGRYIAYCGVIYNDKDGVDILIKAFKELTKIDNDIKLRIIGPIPKDIDNSNTIQLIKDLQLEKKVVLMGEVSYSEMPQLLINATMLALARPQNMRAKYGFPTKLGEYLLTGNPVIVTSVGNIKDFLMDKYNALLAEPDSSYSFYEKMKWIIDHPKESQELGVRGRDAAFKHFDSEKETNKIIDIMHLIDKGVTQ